MALNTMWTSGAQKVTNARLFVPCRYGASCDERFFFRIELPAEVPFPPSLNLRLIVAGFFVAALLFHKLFEGAPAGASITRGVPLSQELTDSSECLHAQAKIVRNS